MLTNGRAIITASAPKAKALKTSKPLRIPPSTKIFTCPLNLSAISSKTAAVAGVPSKTLPPWFETTIPWAPALMAFCAPSNYIIPLTIKGALA